MGNNTPLVTVMIACYNHAEYVGDAIESIMHQTYKNIELIVIDDGSQDNSVQIIQKLAKTYKFKFISRSNKGVAATLNEGLSLSKGKYFCGCGSDDMYLKDKIEKQVNFMESNPQFALVYGNIIQFDGKGYEQKVKTKNAVTGWVFDDIISGQLNLPAITVMQKTEILKELGGFDENLWTEDVDLWLRIADQYKVAYLDEYLVYYRQHGTNISRNIIKMYQSQKIVLDKWKHKDNYSQFMAINKLFWFDILSRKHKKEAEKYIIPGVKKMFTITYLKAIIKYFFYK